MQAAARLAHRPSADGVASTHDKGEGRVCVSERTLVWVAVWASSSRRAGRARACHATETHSSLFIALLFVWYTHKQARA